MLDPNIITGNGFEFTFKDNNWIWKAVPMQKMHMSEKPQIKVVAKIEEKYQNFFDVQLANITKSISRYLV